MLCMWCVIFEVFWEQKAAQIGCMVLDVVMLCVHFAVHTGNCIGVSLSDFRINHVKWPTRKNKLSDFMYHIPHICCTLVSEIHVWAPCISM